MNVTAIVLAGFALWVTNGGDQRPYRSATFDSYAECVTAAQSQPPTVGSVFRNRGASLLRPKLGQLGDVHGNAPRLIFRHQLGRRSPPRLILGINGEHLAVGVANDKAGVVEFFNRPWWREATSGRAGQMKSANASSL